jgi:hypothetical protein
MASRLGLEQYAPAFAENAIDWKVLPKLTSDDFREIGVVAVGHGRKLLEAIAVLREATRPDAAVMSRADAAEPQDRPQRPARISAGCLRWQELPRCRDDPAARHQAASQRAEVGMWHSRWSERR